MLATLLLKKLQHVGHVHVGQIWIVLWISGPTGVTHFQP